MDKSDDIVGPVWYWPGRQGGNTPYHGNCSEAFNGDLAFGLAARNRAREAAQVAAISGVSQ